MKCCLIYNFAQHYRAGIFQLIDKEFDCDFVFGNSCSDIKKMNYNLLKHQVFEVRNIRFKHYCFQKNVLKFLFKDYNTYIILGETRCLSTWLFVLLSIFFPKKKIYFWSHGWLGNDSKLKKILTKIFYSFVDGAFIYNNRSRQLMIDGGFSSKKLHTIYNSLDYDAQLAIRKELTLSDVFKEHFGNANKTLIFIGRLTKIKQLDLIIKALWLLKQKNEFYNLILIGDGGNRYMLEMLTRDKGLVKQVWFYGASYNEKENARLIYNADLCVSPGNIGLTAIHALMFGCPALTNDDFDSQMPEFEAIQQDKTGTFFKYGDVHDLANKILMWFKLHNNDREQIRHNCYAEIDSKWNPNNQIRIFKEVLLRKC